MPSYWPVLWIVEAVPSSTRAGKHLSEVLAKTGYHDETYWLLSNFKQDKHRDCEDIFLVHDMFCVAGANTEDSKQEGRRRS